MLSGVKLHCYCHVALYCCVHADLDTGGFRSLKITQDGRDYAAGLGNNEKVALGLDVKTAEAGMTTMSEKYSIHGLTGDSYPLADVATTPYINRFIMFGLSNMWTQSRPQRHGVV